MLEDIYALSEQVNDRPRVENILYRDAVDGLVIPIRDELKPHSTCVSRKIRANLIKSTFDAV